MLDLTGLHGLSGCGISTFDWWGAVKAYQNWSFELGSVMLMLVWLVSNMCPEVSVHWQLSLRMPSMSGSAMDDGTKAWQTVL